MYINVDNVDNLTSLMAEVAKSTSIDNEIKYADDKTFNEIMNRIFTKHKKAFEKLANM